MKKIERIKYFFSLMMSIGRDVWKLSETLPIIHWHIVSADCQYDYRTIWKILHRAEREYKQEVNKNIAKRKLLMKKHSQLIKKTFLTNNPFELGRISKQIVKNIERLDRYML